MYLPDMPQHDVISCRSLSCQLACTARYRTVKPFGAVWCVFRLLVSRAFRLQEEGTLAEVAFEPAIVLPVAMFVQLPWRGEGVSAPGA